MSTPAAFRCKKKQSNRRGMINSGVKLTGQQTLEHRSHNLNHEHRG